VSGGGPKKSAEGPLAQATYAIGRVAEFYGLSLRRLLGTARNKHVARPRQIAMWLCRNIYDLSFPDIGRVIGRDHSTVLNGCDKISRLLRQDPAFADELDRLVRFIDPRHRILESTYRFVLNNEQILNLPELSEQIMEIACDRSVNSVEVTYRLLRGTPPETPPGQERFLPTRQGKQGP